MEFTEIREVDDIAAYARSFHVRKVTVDTDGSFHYARQPAFDTFAHGERLEYEKALQDTPPNSATILFEKKQDDAISDIIGEDEPEENIMNDIQESLREQSLMHQQIQTQSKLKTQKTVSFDVQEVVEQEEDENDENEENKNSGKTTDTVTADQKDEDEVKKQRSATQTFEKMNDDFVSKSYMESRNLKSFLTARTKALPVGRDGSNFIKRGEMKTFKVYFFTKEISLQIPVNISANVQEVIQQCLDSFKANPDLDQSLIKFPDRPEIYDLKASEDGPSLDKAREFKSIRTGRELFLSEPADVEIQARRNSKLKEEVIIYHITIHLPDEMRTEIPIELNSNSQLKEVYTCLAAQKITAYTSQFYNMRLYFTDPEKKFKETKNYLDPSMPIKTLKNRIKGNTFDLEFVKKQFADEPTEKRKQSDFMGRERSVTVDHDSHILLNPVSANRYEEFEVIKINESGKRQVRIMGIDGFKIYNYTKKYKEEPQGGGGMADMFLNMAGISKFGTMKPERLLTDVLSIRLINPTTFQLEVKEDGVTRYVDYEVEDKKYANQIVAKIKYLK